MLTLSARPSTLARILRPLGLIAGGSGGRLAGGCLALLGDVACVWAYRRGGEGVVRMIAKRGRAPEGEANGGEAYGDLRGEPRRDEAPAGRV